MASKPIPPDRLPVLQKSFGHLCEWLNLENEQQGRSLVDGCFVRPFFEEYRRDFLEPKLRTPTVWSPPSLSSSSTSSIYHENHGGGGGGGGGGGHDVSSVVKCNDLYSWCISTNAFRQPKYTAKGAGDKKGWAAIEHTARFIVRVLTYSWSHNGEWDSGNVDPLDDEKGGDGDGDGDGDLEFFQVWAILKYLQAEWEAANLRDWDTENMTLLFSELSTSRF
ncbi:hypothetical protein F5Y17DRAFT_293487 [Xylariaceae sp. FL0594]|nr:hypothetical protein F5Y17DRAFT_293487 [Xylariaceae sp. FL0594]